MSETGTVASTIPSTAEDFREFLKEIRPLARNLLGAASVLEMIVGASALDTFDITPSLEYISEAMTRDIAEIYNAIVESKAQ